MRVHLLIIFQSLILVSLVNSLSGKSIKDIKLVEDKVSQCRHIEHIDPSERCQFVKDHCTRIPQFFDYLQLSYCTLPKHTALFVFFMFGVLLLSLSLLATTCEYFFVPHLQLLSVKLKLSPSIAGITLLALGNGAPDVFTSISGISSLDADMVFGAMVGAATFTTTIVLGAVLLSAPRIQLNRIECTRDIISCLVVAVFVIIVAVQKRIQLIEAVGLVFLYFVYIGVALWISWRYEGEQENQIGEVDESEINLILENDSERPLLPDSQWSDKESNSSFQNDAMDLFIPGLSWNSTEGVMNCMQFIVEFPFSIVRWLSIPGSDGHWSPARRIMTVISPTLFWLLILMTIYGKYAFYIKIGQMPLFMIGVLICPIVSLLLYHTTSDHKVPHSYGLLSVLAFIASVSWMHILANEVVAILQSMGLYFNVSSSILGMFILALGNCIGDLVANISVSRRGQTATAVTACFASPLFAHLFGLGISFIFAIVSSFPNPFYLALQFPYLIVGWTFLLSGLCTTIIYFNYCQFSPLPQYGFFLIGFYFVFVTITLIISLSE